MTQCDEVPLIEFLNAELNADETEELLHHVENCVDCRERLQVMAAIAASYPEAEAEKRRRISNRTLWLLAAGILVALLTPILYLQMSLTGMGSLATSEKYPAGFPLITRGGVEVGALGQVRGAAYEAYRRGDFERSGALLKLLPRDADTLFYLGVSQYFSGEPEQALGNLQRAGELDFKWRQPAGWYRASAYLKMGQKDKARKELSQLVKANGEYSKKAEELLEKLE
jgi:tetratricopeptide (TPR) repeat protein